MLKLATILDNPGEPFASSRYRDFHDLTALGYDGLVLYETTGLSGVDRPEVVADGEIRRFVAQQFDVVRERVEQAGRAGLAVYLTYDVLSLARDVVLASEDGGAAMTCLKRPGMLCPASDAAIERSGRALESLLAQYPSVKGVVLRFGDNDAARLPYLMGNDIYTPHCARCAGMGRADRIIQVVNHFHRIVVERGNRRLIVRAWNVRPNGLHDSVELCKRVCSQLPGDPSDDRLVLSFKVTHTDFWRYQRWNPASLACGERPVVFELQCQREFEGKGGVPNWQVPLWRDGCPEVRNLPGATFDNAIGIAEASKRVKLAGLWAWVRGGGWGGPFVTNEAWIDANVYAVPKLADDPSTSSHDLAKNWIEHRLGLTDPVAAEAVMHVLEHSPEVVRQAFYIGPFARTKTDPWHPNADWIQDDLVNAKAAWRLIQKLPDSVLDEVIAEKQAAVDATLHDRIELQAALKDSTRAKLEPMINSMIYAESLFQALRDLLAGMVAFRRAQKGGDTASTEVCRQRLLAAQSHWNQHTQRHGSMPGAATAFRESHFWELTQEMLGKLG